MKGISLLQWDWVLEGRLFPQKHAFHQEDGLMFSLRLLPNDMLVVAAFDIFMAVSVAALSVGQELWPALDRQRRGWHPPICPYYSQSPKYCVKMIQPQLGDWGVLCLSLPWNFFATPVAFNMVILCPKRSLHWYPLLQGRRARWRWKLGRRKSHPLHQLSAWWDSTRNRFPPSLGNQSLNFFVCL